MGYNLTPIAVDLGHVSGVFGSKNEQLLSILDTTYGDEFEKFDEMAADMADDEGDAPLTMRDAFTQMIMGEEYNEEFGCLYGYAFQYICHHFGDRLSNQEWSAMPSGSAYVEAVDEALKAAGVGTDVLRVGRLIYRRGPVPLPRIDDFPSIGYLRVDEIGAALKVLDEDALSAVQSGEIRSSLAELRGWLLTCAARKRDLVCFYS